jgi:serine/threonine protein kinase
MTSPGRNNPESLSLAAEERMDVIYCRFKQSCQAGERPRIQQYLQGLADSELALLLPELLPLELHDRVRTGERPTAEEYLLLFPTQEELIRPLLKSALADPSPISQRETTSGCDASFNTPPPLLLTPTPSDRNGELSFLGPPQADGELGRLGRFRVLEVLGIGGMGIVFRAGDPELPREIALKVMRPAFTSEPEAQERFLHEAWAMAKVKNDHVITIHYVGTIGSVAFVAMELLRGQSLHHRLERRHRLPWPEVVQIGIETARGLAAAHERGLIHRDIKPSNLWLEELPGAGPNERGERVKVLDFGLARQIDCDRSLSSEGTPKGTPAYMAPEQARGENVDERADLFSLGCVLYEMVTGSRPFPGRDPYQILLQICNHQPAPPLQVIPEMPVSLSRLIEELLAKERDQRPSSARELVARLQGIVGQQKSSSSGTSPLVQPDPPPAVVASNPAPDAGGTDVLRSVWQTVPSGEQPRSWGRWLKWVSGIAAVASLVTILALALLKDLRSNSPSSEPPGPGQKESSPGATLPLEVFRWEAEHVEWKGGFPGRAGLLGVDVFTPRLNDHISRVEAELSEPAYAYLLAYLPDGREELCWPDPEEQTPTQSIGPRYPRLGKKNKNGHLEDFKLEDGVGLQVFVLAASRQPLPPYSEWRNAYGHAHWQEVRLPDEQSGVVWRDKGLGLDGWTDLYPFRPGGVPANRGKGADRLDVQPLQDLRNWWQGKPGIEVVALLAVTVGPR